MLNELHIENFAIIDRLELRFGPGLIIFTGETGAGKSILIDAVELLLGSRSDITFIRNQAERASIEGVFRLTESTGNHLRTILEREDLLDDPDYITLGREIRTNGRSVARVNGRSVNVALLKELGELLIDVHGQSEHLSLLKVGQHLFLLDAYAGIEKLLEAYQTTYQRLQKVRRELKALREAESEAARRIDTLGYQINEIEAARLNPGEEGELREERNRLANAEGLAKLAQEALMLLDEGTPDSPAATDLLGQVVVAINHLSRLDPSQSNISEQANRMFDALTDLSVEIRSYSEAIEFNPRRLDRVEERLGLISDLKRKYGSSIQVILAYAEDARLQREAISNAGERILELEAEESHLLTQLATEGQKLSDKRRRQATQLSHAIEKELVDLQMDSARFRVDFVVRPDPNGVPLEDGRRVAFDANGLERVEFLIAPNPGEGFKPLAKIASGGETSRLMLALKHVLAAADRVPTLIFDEIDQGIGGRVGTTVGKKLKGLARQHQVLCVTHLPQLATYGSQHFNVQKNIQDGRTLTQVHALSGDSRLKELAQMYGKVSEGTLHSALELLQSTGEIPSTT
jgi:DNA repair protein RecN (Recombination protein N)